MKEDTILVEITKMRKGNWIKSEPVCSILWNTNKNVSKWEQKENTPAPYIPEMMSYILHLEKRVKGAGGGL